MRINVYAEEMTDRVEIVSKKIDGQEFTGLRIYLELPVTIGGNGNHRSDEGPMVYEPVNGQAAQVSGPFLRRPGDDDSSAVTFWVKQDQDMRVWITKALWLLDKHYAQEAAMQEFHGKDDSAIEDPETLF